MKKSTLGIAGLALLALAGGAGWYAWKQQEDAAPKWRTATVERGDVQVAVTATGTLQAVTTVLVGTQVSGTIATLHADFNSEVKKGQVIARLDSTLLLAALADVRSNLNRVEAQDHQAALELKRTQALFDRTLVSQAELDQAVAAARVAAANMASARSQVERARINLSYSTIKSPIDGIILSRAVDVGQTVAASFNTPTLFTIAGDLREMQVKASVDEADIGKVRAGQEATFTVDAFPEAVFTGTVEQVRLEPKVDQNVVSYDVVLRVPNPDKKLMPGMTANLTIAVTSKKDVLLVPVAALRFRPPRDPKDTSRLVLGPNGEAVGKADAEEGGWKKRREGRDSREGHEGRANRESVDSALASGPGGRHGSRDSSAVASSDSAGGRRGRGGWKGGEGSGEGRGSRGKVFLLVDGKPSAVRVRTGLSDGSRTEVEGDGIAEGTTVLTGTEGAAAGAAAARPFGMQPGGAGGMRGGGGGRRGM